MKSGERLDQTGPLDFDGAYESGESAGFQDLKDQVPFVGDDPEIPSLINSPAQAEPMSPEKRKELEAKMRDSVGMFRRLHKHDDTAPLDEINKEISAMAQGNATTQQFSGELGHDTPWQPAESQANNKRTFEGFWDTYQPAEAITRRTPAEAPQVEPTEAGEDDPEDFIDIEQFATKRGESKDKKAEEMEQKKTRSEKRLEEVQRKLDEIESRLNEANSDQAALEAEIVECDEKLSENLEAHDQLTDKVNHLRDNINKTKRNIISGFADGLKIVKNLMLGRHKEVRDIISNISANVDANEKATQDYDSATKALRANETEKVALANSRAAALDAQNTNARKIASLEKWRADTQKQLALLSEEVEEERKAKAWEDAREAIKAEMGTDNMTAFRRDLVRQKEDLEEGFQADLDELDSFRHPSRIQMMMRTEEELRDEAVRADEVERKLRAEYEKRVAEIDSKIAKIDEYFPTWRERTKKARESGPVKSSLATLKRKVLLRAYDAAA